MKGAGSAWTLGLVLLLVLPGPGLLRGPLGGLLVVVRTGGVPSALLSLWISGGGGMLSVNSFI